jgi:hypothetical protein
MTGIFPRSGGKDDHSVMMSLQGIGFLFCFTFDRFSVSFFMTRLRE